MKQKLLFLAAMMLAMAMPPNACAYDFSAVTPSGHTLYYEVVYEEISDGFNGVFIVRDEAPNLPDAYIDYDGSVVDVNGNALWASYPNISGDLIIPSTVTNYAGTVYQVVGIGDMAFFGCQGLTSVTIASSVTYISDVYVFAGCSNLTSVIMGESPTTIPELMFAGCHNLVSVQLPTSLSSIGNQAFYYCTSLPTITIPNTCTSIGVNAFMHCTSLASLTIPNSVTHLGDLAFANCDSLSSIVIGNGINNVNIFHFNGCTGITSITVEAGNTVYDSRDNCNAIIETSSNTLIFGCSTTTIPNTVTTIGEWAFIASPDTITIPEGVTNIGWGAFGNGLHLKAISLPNTLTQINGMAFSGAKIDTLHLPASVQSIGQYAFGDCDSLNAIVCGGVTPPVLGDHVFYRDYIDPSSYDIGNPEATLIDVPVHVPLGMVPTYRAAQGWNEFSVITDEIIADTIIHNDTVDTTVSICDTIVYQLPYTADFTQCWTALNGAEIVDEQHASFNGLGQELRSPWIEFEGGECYIDFTILRDDLNNPWWYEPDSTASLHVYILNEDGEIAYFDIGSSSKSDGFTFNFVAPAGRLRCVFENTDTAAHAMVQLITMKLYSYPMSLTTEGPDTVQVGDTMTLQAHLTMPEGETPDSWEWTFRNGLGYSAYISSTDTTMVSSTDSSRTLVWNNTGIYYINIDVRKNNPYAYVSVRHIVMVVAPDTTVAPDICDTMSYALPYNADFTQCWSTTSGISIVNPTDALFSMQNSTLTSPVIHADSDTYIHLTIEPYGDITDTTLYQSSVNSVTINELDVEGNIIGYHNVYYLPNLLGEHDFKLASTGDIRIKIASTTNTAFRITNFWVDSYPWSIQMHVPDTVYRYHSSTFIAFANLPDTTEEIAYTWMRGTSDMLGQDDTLQFMYTSTNYYGYYTIVLRAVSKYHGSKELSKYPVAFLSRPCTGNPITQFPYTQDFEYGTDCWQIDNSYSGTLVTDGGAHEGYNFYRIWRYSNEHGTLKSPILELNSTVRYMVSFFARQQHNSKLNVYFGKEEDTLSVILPLTNAWSKYEMILPESTIWVGYHAFDGQYVNGDNASVVELDNITITPLGIENDNSITVVDTVHIDTVVYNYTTIDSVQWNIIQEDSIIYFYDTTCAIHDTIIVTVTAHDTTIVTDTTYITVTDTTYITVTDTILVTQHDTITNTVFDTLTVNDTIWLTRTDTLLLHDTIIIHDTVYITQEGIDDIDAINAKLYTSNGQIVVEGADGNMVTMYDINGRMLATKREMYAPLRFETPASGTYIIKIGNHAARKVVVIR